MNVLAELRAVAPNRRLTFTEAVMIAERQANLLLKRLGVDGPAVQTSTIAALPFLHVAVRMGLQSSGATKWIKPRWVVLLNGLEPGARQRFSLAHELKHIIDHPRARTVGVLSDDAHRQVEQLCDYFAGCLLMPRGWVKKAYGDGIQSVSHLAELFQVSPRAMEVRLAQLGLSEPYKRCGGIHDAYLRSRPASPLGLVA